MYLYGTEPTFIHRHTLPYNNILYLLFIELLVTKDLKDFVKVVKVIKDLNIKICKM